MFQDLRYGVRMLLKNKAFTTVCVLTLALGIGANTAVFGLLNTLLLRPLAIPEPERLIAIYSGQEGANLYRRTSYPNYTDLRDRTRELSSVAAYSWPIPINLATGSDEPSVEVAWAHVVSGNFFDVLGLRPHLGRQFAPEEDRTRNSHRVVIVSHKLWRARLGGDPSAVGRTLKLNGHSFQVIGVAPERMAQVDVPFVADLWVPLAVQEMVMPGQHGKLDGRTETWLRMLARTATGSTLERVRAELQSIARGLEQTHPSQNRKLAFTALPEGESRARMLGTTTRLSWALLAITGFILLIACANIAALLSARSLARAREISIRTAIGAGRGRLLRQLLTESLTLALLGGGLGVGAAAVLSRYLHDLVVPPVPAPTALDFSLDLRVLAFTLAVTCVTAVLFGLAPAWRASRSDLTALLTGGNLSAPGGRPSLDARNLLVAGQVALSLVLLVAAALFLKSMQNARQIDIGFVSEHRLLASVNCGRQGYSNEQGKRFYDQLLERVRAIPGVLSVTTTAFLPLSGGYLGDTVVYPEGKEVTPEERRPVVIQDRVGSAYFKTMGTPLLRGRDLTDFDREGTPQVAIVNETFAQTFWPQEDPVGKRFRVGAPGGPAVEVVGLVRDGRYENLGETPQRRMFLAVRQQYQSAISLIVHTAGSPRDVAAKIRAEVRSLDPYLPVTGVKTMSEHLGLALHGARTAAVLVSAFGLVGLVLAVIGVYGVLAFMVSQRTREIGVRMALGATPARVVGLVMRRAMGMVLAGVVLGAGGAWALTRFLAGLLYDVSATDPFAFVSAVAALTLAALVAVFLPARRAAKVDPMVVLRHE